LLVPIIGGCTEEGGNDPVNGAGIGGAVLPQSGGGGFVLQAGMGGTLNQGESGSGPQAGSDPAGIGGGVVGGSGGVVGGGSGGQALTGGSGGTEPIGGPCPVEPSTTGVHIIVNISWPATAAILGGDGQLDIWVISKDTPGEIQADGSYDLNSEVRACGSLLPELQKAEFLGGGRMYFDVPWEAFDAPTMKSTPTTGRISSADIGATIDMDPNVTLVGLDLPDPLNYVWPNLGSEIVQYATDAEGDGKPGITSIPRAQDPFDLPPTDLASAVTNQALADRVYAVTRSIVKLTGTRDSCDTASGTAEVTAFDMHIVGCRLADGGADCDTTQSDFVDFNRTIYELHEGTYQQVTLSNTATCADVLAALPAQ